MNKKIIRLIYLFDKYIFVFNEYGMNLNIDMDIF